MVSSPRTQDIFEQIELKTDITNEKSLLLFLMNLKRLLYITHSPLFVIDRLAPYLVCS